MIRARPRHQRSIASMDFVIGSPGWTGGLLSHFRPFVLGI